MDFMITLDTLKFKIFVVWSSAAFLLEYLGSPLGILIVLFKVGDY